MDASTKNDLLAQVENLSRDHQQRVLDFAKSLDPKGVEGKNLLRFEGVIPAEDLQQMSKAIKEG